MVERGGSLGSLAGTVNRNKLTKLGFSEIKGIA